MPQDNHEYQYVLLISDIFSKFIQSVALQDQTANSIVEAFLRRWVYIHELRIFFQQTKVLMSMERQCTKFVIRLA